MDLITLIRNNNCEIKYDVEYQKEWSDDELLSHIIFLNCYNNQLTTLPDLINCKKLQCGSNQLTILPDLINCQELQCSLNQLITLPNLINCQVLYCHHNQLTTLPDLINCQVLWCRDNQLIYDNIEDHKKL